MTHTAIKSGLRMGRPTLASVTLWALFSAGACYVPEAPKDVPFRDQDVGRTADGVVPDLSEVEAQVLPIIDGVWLQYSQISTCVDIVGHFEQMMRAVYLVESSQDDSGVLQEQWTACEIELTPLLGMQPTVSQALLDGTYPVVTAQGLVNATRVGGDYVSGALAEIWGIAFDDPIHDLFPDNSEDSRIYDSDGDGHPAATLMFGVFCDSYVAQRTISNYHGTFISPDRIEGTAVSATRQLVIDATQPLCEVDYETRPNSARNSFGRIRIDGQGHSLDLDSNGDSIIGCEEVVPFRDTLFDTVTIDDESCEVAD